MFKSCLGGVFRIFFKLMLMSMLIVSQGMAAHKDIRPVDAVRQMVIDTGDNTNYAIVVEKSSQQLFVFQVNGTVSEVFRTKCSTGEVDGPKLVSGDKKTPEGVYFFVKHHRKKDLAPIYGTRAFPMDYPNRYDRHNGLTGSAIWLHGTNKKLKPRNSNGCVVLNNRDIDKVAKYIDLHRTPIIVVEHLPDTMGDGDVKGIKNEIRSYLLRLNNALENGSYHQYLGYFDADYLPDIDWWRKWMQIRKEFVLSSVPISVKLENFAIYRHKDLYVVLADQVIRTENQYQVVGTLKYFITKNDSRYAIVGDVYHVMPDDLKTAVTRAKGEKHPLVVKSSRLHQNFSKEKNIQDMLDDWIDAWSNKDISKYGKYYSRQFRNKGMNRNSWLNYKRKLNRKYRYIRVSMDKLSIEKGEKMSKATFIQTYNSDRFKEVGRKRLLLKLENGEWKIYREIWEKI